MNVPKPITYEKTKKLGLLSDLFDVLKNISTSECGTSGPSF